MGTYFVEKISSPEMQFSAGCSNPDDETKPIDDTLMPFMLRIFLVSSFIRLSVIGDERNLTS